MPKKKKKPKIKKKTSKKRKVSKKRSKIKKRSSKKKRVTKKNFINKQAEKTSSSELIFKTKKEWIKNSLASKSQYQSKYNDSIKNNSAFWKKEGKRITWIKPYKKLKL